ncbi:MAG: 23S rRNA (uracil(1939)-C(5))-methyltransferase RlmD [Acidobacteriota bacterium]|nr:23S rRNA (uracil(1939)-C(5))-methyltransferase RlmD [Acidobacteriota bacterium]
MTSHLQPAQTAPTDEAAAPPCPHFGPCGGCQLQHLTYQAQLAGKAERLRGLLGATLADPPALQLHASPPLGYRNRIRLTLAQVEGRLRAGYLRAADAAPRPAPEDAFDFGPDEPPANSAPAHTSMGKLSFLPITECPIAAPVLWRTAEAFLALASEPLGAWLHDRHIPDQLELFTNADESRLNLTLSLRTTSRTLPEQIVAAFAAFCEQLRTQVPALSGAGISLLPLASRKRSRRAEAPRPGATWSAAGLHYIVANPLDLATPLGYWVPRTAFFQVNRFLIPELVALATEQAAAAPKKSLAWDLYAGAGLFSRPLARLFDAVTAVEIAEAAHTALAGIKLPNLHAVRSTTLDFLRAAVLQRERPDLVLLDPPRTGAGAEVCALLGRLAAPTLIYVSCSPEHLAPDLGILAAAGYKVDALHLFDLFPQTTHTETVAILTR